MRIRGFLFDLDGTVVETSYDWPLIRRELGCGGTPILSYLDGLSEPERSRKSGILERYEEEQTRSAALKEGVTEFLELLAAQRIRTALITNNSRRNADYLLAKFALRFDVVLTRETGLWKPSGKPLVEGMKRLGVARAECAAVGDSSFDVRAAKDAGVPLIFVLNADGTAFAAEEVEIVPTIVALRARIEGLIGDS